MPTGFIVAVYPHLQHASSTCILHYRFNRVRDCSPKRLFSENQKPFDKAIINCSTNSEKSPPNVLQSEAFQISKDQSVSDKVPVTAAHSFHSIDDYIPE